MDYNKLLDLSTDIGYRLAVSGAETFRVEESINRILMAYGVSGEVFAITNCLIVSIETPDGEFITRMKRIGHHGNNLDAVERYNHLSRRICAQVPSLDQAQLWLQETDDSRVHYKLAMLILGNFLGAFGFSIFFGGVASDALWAGVCGIAIGLINHFSSNLKVNPFFTTISASFVMALLSYLAGALHLIQNADAAIIGAIMLLVPGLLFTNAMRDIIFGDTNSGTNRIVQVLLIAAAIALGTGAAWGLSQQLFGAIKYPQVTAHPYWVQIIGSFVACFGFSLIYNIHGHGMPLCALGGAISWAAYCVCAYFGTTIIVANFVAAVVAAAYAETMARVRKYPAISYLLVSVLPMLPGAGIYYTSNYLVQGNMSLFSDVGLETIAIAGILAVGILLVSTIVRLSTVWRQKRQTK